jgi:glutathione S-transferase
VTGQLHSAYALLEQELQRRPLDRSSERMSQAGVTTAVAWQFTHMLLPGVVDVAKHPALQAFSAAAEQLPEFLAAPPK